MLGLARLVIILLVALTIVYISLSLYSRSVRRRKLEAEWAEEGRTGDRDAFVREGLEDYDGSLRRKLILGVYVVPLALIALIIYLVNFA
jgi:Ca2+/Na+ antiporter